VADFFSVLRGSFFANFVVKSFLPPQAESVKPQRTQRKSTKIAKKGNCTASGHLRYSVESCDDREAIPVVTDPNLN